MEKALGGFGLDRFGCPEPFFLVDSAKILAISCAAEQRLRRWMIGGWSGENLALVRRWVKLLNCWMRFWMPQVLPFGSWKMPSAARELLPLPGHAVTLFHSTYLSSLEGSRRKMAASWVAATAKAIFTSCAQAGRDVSSRFRVRLTFPNPKNLTFAVCCNLSSTFCCRLAQVWTSLLHKPSWTA